MLIAMRRVLSFPLSSALSGPVGGASGSAATDHHQSPTHKGKLPIEQIKQCMVQVLHDVPGIAAQRLQYKINATHNVRDLWMLRSDMYQVVAKLHNQSEAARRINSLLPCFSKWLSAKQLSAI